MQCGGCFCREYTSISVRGIIQIMSKTELDSKHFPEWLERKEALHNANRIQRFSEGEIWWVALGENVGIEINGKSTEFSRPVVVYKKLSRDGFLAIPLTSQPHEGSWYVDFEFKHKMEYAALAQVRVVSAARLYKRMGRLSSADLKKVKTGFRKLYC